MSQTPERRNDIGLKQLFGIFGSVIVVLLGLFVHAAWSTAAEGSRKADMAISKTAENQVHIATIEECLRNMNDNVSEIKDILKTRYQ